jgi:hypothetical protein
VKSPVNDSNLSSAACPCYTIQQEQIMLRKVLLVVLAVPVSFGLTALSGYLVYANSPGVSEAKLSLVVRFAISPIIAILIGTLVGFLNKDHPVLIAVLGLLPWTVMFLASPQKPTSLSV